VEQRTYHAARPGFRIVEMKLGRSQIIPWHYHSDIQDTFYVIAGTIRLRLLGPDQVLSLAPGQSYAVNALRPHCVENGGETSAVFVILQGIGEHDFVALADRDEKG
jgi:quercetin dioxygenase-like cupin family protein